MSRDIAEFRNRYGPWALVTGASEGIGREMARRVAKQGVNLVLVARRREALESLAAELSASGVETRQIVADLATPEGVEAVLAATRAIDVGLLVAAAGFGTSGDFVDSELHEELSMIDVNCRAVATLTHELGRRLVARKSGGIVLLSSLLAFQGVRGAANYAATKAWVQTFAEGLRAEMHPHGVDVIASAPGPVRTGFGARARMTLGLAIQPDVVAKGTLDALGRQTTVRPGVLSLLLEWLLRTLPRRGRVRVMAQIMRGITAHHVAHAAAHSATNVPRAFGKPVGQAPDARPATVPDDHAH